MFARQLHVVRRTNGNRLVGAVPFLLSLMGNLRDVAGVDSLHVPSLVLGRCVEPDLDFSVIPIVSRCMGYYYSHPTHTPYNRRTNERQIADFVPLLYFVFCILGQ